MTRDPRIDDYIAAAAPFAKPILGHVRDRVHAVVPDVVETLKWSMPAYTRDGAILLITAAFKAHAALNFWRGGEIAGGAAKPGAMGQLGKIKRIEDLPTDAALDDMIAEAARLAAAAPAPRKPKSAPRPIADPHPDFLAGLARNPTASAAFDAFPPSHRKEYVTWINDAKRDETRARRIETAIAQIAEGKSQNWKYQR